MSPEPRLLIRLGSLGDVVLATAAAEAARERWGPGAVDVLVKAAWAPLWEGHPAVRRVWVWPASERGPRGVRAWARRLRGEGYVETFDLQASPRTRVLTRLAGLVRVRRPRRRHLRRRLLVHLHRGGPEPGFSVLRTFTAAVDPGSEALPALHPGPGARERARERVPEAGERVGLVPGARHATKRWPVERFVEVGRALAAAGRGPVPVFFGPGSDPEENALLAAWTRLWPGEEGWFPVRAPVLEAAAVLERLAAVAVNDTGLMHVAAAMGVPVVALFGPTVRSFGFAPAGPDHRVLEVDSLSCRPCSLHGGPHCPKGHFRCMLDISPDRVVRALASAPPRPAGRRAVSP